jgi:multidrug efflux pump subunit AcrA (membrane-fusion protein)
VPIKYLAFVKPGQEIKVASNAYIQGQPSTATVTSIIPATDTRSQTFEVRARIDLSDDRIWASGQLVEVNLPLAQQEQITMINRDALIIRKNGIHIIKIDKENKAHRIPVRVGKGQGQLVEVMLDGEFELNPGDWVAVRGAERLAEGQTVEIQSSPL